MGPSWWSSRPARRAWAWSEVARGSRAYVKPSSSRACAVVASLWQVPDAESAQLMPRFIANLVAGESQAAARKAQLTEIASRKRLYRGAHPYFWAAFTVTGIPVLDR